MKIFHKGDQVTFDKSFNLPLSIQTEDEWIDEYFESQLELDLDMPFKVLDRPKSVQMEWDLPENSTPTTKRNLITGEIEWTREETSSKSLSAKSSISMKRAPNGDFVRGTTSNLPFAFGGMETEVKTKDCFDFDTINKIPPGFDRGLDFDERELGIDAEILPITDPTEDTRVQVEKQDTQKDVDDLLDAKLVFSDKKSFKKEWAHMVDLNQSCDISDIDMAMTFPFELDTFQKQAVLHLENSDSVFIAAHTSAGKTVVAEYAIALAQAHMTRAVYTSPIKALSNQKYRDFKNKFEDVGILTGDVQIKPDASCLVMTTEILRSMLYRGADLIRDVEFVIFDEVHYVNDVDRGVVWEEVIIMLPDHITLILLSATVPNTKEFADWVGRTKKKNIYVISTLQRPVPLEHYVYTKDLYKIVDAKKNFSVIQYKKASQEVNTKKKTFDRNLYVTLTNLLKKKNLLPCIIFTFSKRKCEEYASTLSNLDLTGGASEKSEIHVFIETSLSCLKGSDKQLPQILRMRELLSRGIAVHHGGLLPILKEIVEILFTRGLIRVLFATETFAMGVNAPAKSVVFSSIRKHDGIQFRDLLPGEYTQMSGRAGRRGLDDTGVVMIACPDDIPDQLTLNKMILGNPTKLHSQFRITYHMILNLFRVEAIRVEDMMKRSFSENATQKSFPEQEIKLKESEKLLNALEPLECMICSDLDSFYQLSCRILDLTRFLYNQLPLHPSVKSLSPGRVVIVNNLVHRNCLGVILNVGKTYTTLVITNTFNDVLPINQVATSQEHVVIELELPSILLITKYQVPPTDMNVMIESLLDIQNPLVEYDFSKIKQVDFQEAYREKVYLWKQVFQFNCVKCPNFSSHYRRCHQEKVLQEQLADLRHFMSDQNLDLLPEYHQRVRVLEQMGYVTDGVVQLKGRVACEMNTTDELLMTELLFENVLGDFEPAEIVALLSSLVFQESSDVYPVLTPTLKVGLDKLKSIGVHITQVSRDAGLPISEEDVLSNIRVGLVQVVYEWALGVPFKDITLLTDVLEGTIVRCIVRLAETCREVSSAARLIGDTKLYEKMEQAAELIKRDIVFAASLYF